MPHFVVEEYAAGLGRRDLDEVIERAKRAAAEMSAEHVLVRLVESLFVPEDEICLHLFEAPSRQAATEAADRAGISTDRVLLATLTVTRR
jgi:hypothetical protein